MTTETDAELALLRANDAQVFLDLVARREHLQSATAFNAAQANHLQTGSQLLDAKVRLRVTLRRCAIFGCVLAAGWSAFAWAVIR